MNDFLKKNWLYIVVVAMVMVALLGPVISTVAVYAVMVGVCILAGYGAMKAFGRPIHGAIGLVISGIFMIVTNYFGWYDWIFRFAWMMGSFAQGLSGAAIILAIFSLAILGAKVFFGNIKLK